MKTPCYLIDSSIYIFRYYFAPGRGHESQSGREVSTVLSFTRWLLKFLAAERPEKVAACFDESLETGYRHQIDPSYKANRALPDEALAYELLACKKVAELLGLPSYASERYEADDFIGALAKHARAAGLEPYLLTRDKDLGQILQLEDGKLWDYGYAEPLSYSLFSESFGIKPERIHEYLAIAGDAVDGIEGVSGVGKKTVAALFSYFESWSEIKAQHERIATLPIRGASKLAAKLLGAAEKIDSNLQLTCLADYCLDAGVIDLDRGEIQFEQLETLLNELNAPKALYTQLNVLR